jgi:hypothetical protein
MTTEVKKVIKLMRYKYNNEVVDYNVRDDDTEKVDLYNKKDEIVKTISTDELTKLWNIVESE